MKVDTVTRLCKVLSAIDDWSPPENPIQVKVNVTVHIREEEDDNTMTEEEVQARVGIMLGTTKEEPPDGSTDSQ